MRYHAEADSSEMYFGQFARGLPNGCGAHSIRIQTTEHTYEGMFLHGLRHGRGLEIVRDTVTEMGNLDDDAQGETDVSEAQNPDVVDWRFYAGGWCRGHRHGFGVEGCVRLSISSHDEAASGAAHRTCFGHSEDVEFTPEAIVEYHRNVKVNTWKWNNAQYECTRALVCKHTHIHIHALQVRDRGPGYLKLASPTGASRCLAQPPARRRAHLGGQPGRSGRGKACGQRSADGGGPGVCRAAAH